MIDFGKSIISSLFECVDNVGVDLVHNTYNKLVGQYSPVIWTIMTIYIGFQFLQAMQGNKTFYDLMNTVFRVVFVLTLAFHYQDFVLYIYDIVTKEPLVILKAITVNGNQADAVSISQALDEYLHAGLVYAEKIFLMGSWSNPSYLIFAVIVFLMTVLGVVFAVGLIILAKCATIVLLALSPLFIVCSLFEMTKGLFESYIRHLITYALIPILTSTILMILLSVSEQVMAYMKTFDQASFKIVVPFLLMCGIQIYLLAQVLSKASALGSGFALASMASTLNKAKDNIVTAVSGMAGGQSGRQVLKSAGSAAYKGIASRMNRFRNP